MSHLRLIAGGKAKLAARAEASAWITRLHGADRSPEMEAAFRRWLAEAPENAREVEGLSEVWDLVAAVPSQRVPRISSRASSRQRIWARAALVLISCGLAALGAYQIWYAPYYSTDVGEQRIVLLDDGTRVTLNSHTRIRSAFGTSERRVELQRGEAFFEVVHNSALPFRVIAGEHQVTALGTSFVVRYEPYQTAVTLVEGKVAVDKIPPAGASAGGRLPMPEIVREADANKPVILEPGERLVLTAARIEHIDRPLVDALTAWRRGEVVLNDTPLAEAVAEMNRYNETPIVIDVASIAALPVSGLYHTGDSHGFAVTVARLHGLEVHEQGGNIHLNSR